MPSWSAAICSRYACADGIAEFVRKRHGMCQSRSSEAPCTHKVQPTAKITRGLGPSTLGSQCRSPTQFSRGPSSFQARRAASPTTTFSISTESTTPCSIPTPWPSVLVPAPTGWRHASVTFISSRGGFPFRPTPGSRYEVSSSSSRIPAFPARSTIQQRHDKRSARRYSGATGRRRSQSHTHAQGHAVVSTDDLAPFRGDRPKSIITFPSNFSPCLLLHFF